MLGDGNIFAETRLFTANVLRAVGNSFWDGAISFYGAPSSRARVWPHATGPLVVLERSEERVVVVLMGMQVCQQEV